MKDYAKIQTTLEGIYRDAGMNSEQLRHVHQKISQGKICIPLIGVFSGGKSTLLNTLLGQGVDLLIVDADPSTAFPSEIEYSDTQEDIVEIEYRDNERGIERRSVPKYLELEDELIRSDSLSAIKRVHFSLAYDALKSYPDLMLVDMPGFESSIAEHTMAIDGYVENSMGCDQSSCGKEAE